MAEVVNLFRISGGCGGEVTVDSMLTEKVIESRKLGRASIHRYSEILFDEESQGFYVLFMSGQRQGMTLSDSFGKTIHYPTYEDARREEIRSWIQDNTLSCCK